MAEKGDKGPLKTALREKIDLDDSRPLTAGDVQQAIQLPAYARQVASIILFSESEWMYRPQKLSALDKLTNRSKISKNLNWEAEKERIEQFDWMTEAGEKLGLPGHGQMYHFHPIWVASALQAGKFIFTLEIMKTLYPRIQEDRIPDLQDIAAELNANLTFFKLDTVLRRSHFFAQVLEETGATLAVEEDFRYGINALKATFSYFSANPDEADAHGYEVIEGKIKRNGQPMNILDFQAIANGAYGDRPGLGNNGHQSGDGWRFRGRGLKQLTGRYNYSEFTKWHSQNQRHWPNDAVDFVAEPDRLTSIKYALRSAVYFWLEKKLYEIADSGAGAREVDLITDKVNRRTASRDARKKWFADLWNSETLK